MKVTVLVAVYNAEPYLRQCLDSLLCQTHSDLEIMCIDDCSTDASPAILEEYAKRDKRIQLLRMERNSGQAAARNKAIQQSTGDLVCFLDSDDWFSPDSIALAVKAFEADERVDCVLFRLQREWADGRTELVADAASDMPGEKAFELSLDWTVHGVYMVRGDLQREILYDDTCRTFSDDNTTRLHYLRSRIVTQCHGIYHYRQNPTSVSHVRDITRFNFLRANEHMQQMLHDMHAADHLLTLHERVRWFNLLASYRFYIDNRRHFSSADRRYALTEMHRIWRSIEHHRLPLRIRLRFGYAPTPFWWLFRIEEEAFFFLYRIIRGE